MTLSDIAEMLTDAGIEGAVYEAQLLVCHFAGLSRAALLAERRDRDYDIPALTEAVYKRASRYPLQYILGTWEFCGLPFAVSEACLIPRPDTEVIVEQAVKALPDGGKLLDLCTGSGCIAAAVLHMTRKTTGYAVDLYPETAAAAEKNLAALGLSARCTVITGDAMTDLFDDGIMFDVITANPPYVTADEMRALEPELAHEPAHALTDGGDGLSILEAIVKVYKNHLAPGGTMLLEHGWQQGDAMEKIAEENGMTYEKVFDYGGNIRGAKLRNP
ncbi:MAG: peptide chain release factor N(5)-glutamine methyltransferase [Clostridia bacterium]|nr:peptide chain release factor N(5)-glutamine methyltransferase [Clostridia bacterium]